MLTVETYRGEPACPGCIEWDDIDMAFDDMGIGCNGNTTVELHSVDGQVEA